MIYNKYDVDIYVNTNYITPLINNEQKHYDIYNSQYNLKICNKTDISCDIDIIINNILYKNIILTKYNNISFLLMTYTNNDVINVVFTPLFNIDNVSMNKYYYSILDIDEMISLYNSINKETILVLIHLINNTNEYVSIGYKTYNLNYSLFY